MTRSSTRSDGSVTLAGDSTDSLDGSAMIATEALRQIARKESKARGKRAQAATDEYVV